MERTIYSKYSNERAERFCIRTDITSDNEEQRGFINGRFCPKDGRMWSSLRTVSVAWRKAMIRMFCAFCPCTGKTDSGGNVCAVFPFLSGESLAGDVKARGAEAG